MISVPAIRFEGKWLEEAGFRQGQQVEILVEENKLVIMTAEGNVDKGL